MNITKFEKVSLSAFKNACNDLGFNLNNIEEIYQNIQLPKRATKGSAGYDFHLPFAINLKKGDTIIIPTGIRCKMNQDLVLQIYPRSSLGFKYQLTLDNTVGIIDSDYYYFVADKDKKVFFSKTSAEQSNIIAKLKKEGKWYEY